MFMEYTFDRLIKEKVLSKINEYQKYTFVSTILAGFLAHGFMFFNKISYLDDNTYYFGVGESFASGRWGLGIIEVVNDVLGFGNYSMPFWNGLSSLFFIAMAAMLIVGMFRIEHKAYAVLIGAYMAVFPVVTSTFAYMFTAPYYFAASLCMVIAVGITWKYRKGFFCAIGLIAIGMGIYQAYFGVAAALFVMLLLVNFSKTSFEENLKTAFKYLFTLIAGILFYFLMNKFCLVVTKTNLNDYQGINGLGALSLKGILSGIKDAYLMFPKLITGNFLGITNSILIRIAYLVCFFLFFMLAAILFQQIKGFCFNKILYVVLLCLVPLSLAVISVMAFSEDTYIHTLMIYSFVFIAIYPFVLLQAAAKEKVNRKLMEWLHGMACITVAVMTLFYIRLDNTAYLKANYQQENAIAYFTTVIAEIKGTKGYNDELPVVFLGNIDGMDSSIAHVPEFDNITLQGYHTNMNQFISYHAGLRFMKLHCGFAYRLPENVEEIKEMEYVKDMPCYPQKGSIEVIDDVVVVKFSKYE